MRRHRSLTLCCVLKGSTALRPIGVSEPKGPIPRASSRMSGWAALLLALSVAPALAKDAAPVPVQSASFLSGWFVGAEGGLITPYFERDVLGADEQFGAANSLEVFSFDWDADGAYRGWIGHQTPSGFGVALSHARLNQSTDFSRTEDAGGDLRVAFDPDSDDPTIFVDGTLIAENSLDLQVTDLEVWQTIQSGAMALQLGAGIRYAIFDRRYFAYETGGPEFVLFDHEFSGFGPSLNYEVEVPLTRGLSLYNGGRAALLFGEHSSSYQGEAATEDAGALTDRSLITTLDAEIGVQWRGQLAGAPGELTLRAGLDGQAWINGGGWDLYDDDMGADFPQHTGSFGMFGLVASAQYTFGVPGDAQTPCGILSSDCGQDLPDIVTGGWFVGAEGGLITPYFQRDILAADEQFGAANSFEVFSFDWDADGAYRGWAGYETASGFGVALSHARLNQSTDFSRTEDAGGDLRLGFDPDSDDAEIAVNGTLIADNSLDLHVTDLEVWHTMQSGPMALQLGAGVRYATFDRRYFAYETGGPEFILFDHEFSGFGPSLNYEVEVPLAHGLSLYNGGRAALLFGEHSARYDGDEPTEDTGALTNRSLITTLDAEIGVQWRGHVGDAPGELTLRAGLDGQAWLNGGGWDIYDDDGGADFPQHTGSFGTFGLVASAQYTFGVPGDTRTPCGILSSDCGQDLPDIVTGGWLVGAEGGLVTPYFERDVLGADEQFGAANTLEVFSFDWDADGAYRGWTGYETASGFGVALSHARLNQSTGFSRTEDAGGQLEVHFDPDSDDADISVDGTLIAETSLDLHVTDLEVWQTMRSGPMALQFGAGIRYATFDRRFLATETGGDEFILFDHEFSGFGPSLNYEVEVPIAHGFSLYNGGRAALLFGEHSSNYQGEAATEDAGALTNRSLITTLDAQGGVQWRGQLAGAPGELTLRAGLDGQIWLNGGGWDLYRDDGGGEFPQHAGSFGAYGFVVSAQMKF